MTTSAPRPRPPTRRRRYSAWRLLRANLYDLLLLLRQSWGVLVGFGLLLLAGALYLTLSPLRMGLAAALYETLRLLTLQSGLDLPDDLIGQALFFLIPLLGLALIFQSVLNFGRLLFDKASRREAWQVALAATYRGHIVVCGLSRVSVRVITQLLAAGYDVVAIERAWDSAFVERVLSLRVPVVLGDARADDILRQAGLPHARALVVGINDDLLNIEIALSARALHPSIRVVLRVFDETLDRRLEQNFGPNTAFSASALAAPTFAAASVSREVYHVLPFGDSLIGCTQVIVQAESQLSGFIHAVETAHGIRVIHHQNAAGVVLPRQAMRQLSSGDQVTLLGTLDALEALRVANVRNSKLDFLSPLPPQRPTTQLDTVIVCGLGKVGYRVIRRMHRLRPRPRIVLIRGEDTRPELLRLVSRMAGVTTLIGDARDEEVLRAAGIANAYAVTALASDDLVNLQIGLAARSIRPDVHLVLRVFSDTLAEQLAGLFGIHTAYSTSALAGPTLAAAAVLGDVTHAFFTGGVLFSADDLVLRAGDLLDGRTVKDIRETQHVLVIGLRRAGETLLLPALDVVLAPGDAVTVLATTEALERLRAALGQREHAGTTGG